MARSALLNVMVQAVRKASRGLTRDFGEVENLQVSRKGPGDFVTAADRKAEKILFEELSRARPGYGFLMEESGAVKGSDPEHRWIIDPLDGTTNFLHGMPIFAISVGLERNGKMAAGVIYNPITDELFTAERGAGAYLNDRRLRVAARNGFSESLLGTGIPHIGHGDLGLCLKELSVLAPQVSGIRRSGAAAIDLAWVAAGRMDGFWEHQLHPWDMAAGILMIQEAGGFVSDLTGRDAMFKTGDIVAGNELIHPELLKALKSVRDKA